MKQTNKSIVQVDMTKVAIDQKDQNYGTHFQDQLVERVEEKKQGQEPLFTTGPW